MTTITLDQQKAIEEYVMTHTLSMGVGSSESACSIAAINLALTGKLTDDVPKCMSPVIGRWIITIQDSMPESIRNGNEWKSLLPLAAGTGRAHEEARLQIVLDWMWETVLPSIQHVADKHGFGTQWKTMTTEKTAEAADAARTATAHGRAAAYAAHNAAYATVHAAYTYAYAASVDAAGAAASDAAYASAADAADAAYAAFGYAAAAVYAADAAAYAADAARAAAWKAFNPAALLERLINACSS